MIKWIMFGEESYSDPQQTGILVEWAVNRCYCPPRQILSGQSVNIFLLTMNIHSIAGATMRVAVTFLLVAFAGTASADRYDFADGFNPQKKEGDEYSLIVSPYTRHFTYDPKHAYVWLVGIERERKDNSLAGVSFFSNSFGQPSAYFYPWGMKYHELFGQPQLYAKLTAGLLYGYRGEYKNKVPFNFEGFSPGIVPALGWDLGEGFEVQANLLGFNAMMFQLSLPLK